MSYQVGSISSILFGGSSTDGKASSKSANAADAGVGGLFSDSNKQLYARSFKPEEFPKMTIEKEPEEEVKKKRKPKKAKKEASEDAATAEADKEDKEETPEEEKTDCTLFVGNIPISETVKSITKLFTEYGPVDSVRLRSVPVAGTKVDEAGNQNLVKKVCVNDKKFGEQKGSFNAYVVFKTREGASAALAANNRVVGERHIRVDRSVPTLFDTNRTVFLGNLPHYADEEELRVHFANVLPNKQEDIEGVRLIRDPETLVGKGIGYLLLKDRDAVMKALSLHNEPFKKRWNLRVTTCGKRTKRSPKPEARGEASTATGGGGSSSRSKSDDSDAAAAAAEKPLNKGGVYPDRKESKKRKHDNADFALKRIKLKSTVTRDKHLKSTKQKKAQPGRKGKRLGGVVKRAMKAANAKK